MSQYPNEDEEFELMYGDELELLREHEEFFDPAEKSSNKPSTNSRKHEVTTTNSQTQSCFNSTQEHSQIEGLNVVRQLFDENDVNVSNTSKKRSVEELFGDIDDILFEDQVVLKKHKGNDERQADLDLIEYIVALRKASAEQKNLTLVRTNVILPSEKDKYNLSYCVPKYPFVAIVRHDEQRVYVRCHSEEYEKEEMGRIVKNCSFNGVMGDAFKTVWEDARKLINKALDQENTERNYPNEISILEPSVDQNKQLWVDLYKPRKYLELLSDESTNRIMLRWLKLWDKVVFNRRPKIRPIEDDPKNKKWKFFNKQEFSLKLDEDGRPLYKVALLCGPPGLGKTTLAHMVAKHAGYNVVEINASDDRSTDVFKTALENATQMRSVIDLQQRPNCLIFDEIDGAPSTSIDYLIKFVTGTATSRSKSKKGNNSKIPILKRPIICICNDVYVPALRPLRQISFIINFPPTASTRLAERLMEIARRQQVKTDLGAMLALAEKSHNDIRSCLSVLHFFKARGKPVTLSEVYRANVGQKDMQKGLFAVWQDIFMIERTKNADGLSAKSRMNRIAQTVASFGDYERLAQGVFENYPLMKMRDSTLDGICQSLEWFCFSDIMNKQIYVQQNYSLASFLQYAFVVWHFVFGTSTWHKLQYPSAGYEARTKQIRRRALVSEVLKGMQPLVRAHSQRLSLVLDSLPFLSRIIVPSFRPVSLHLYTKEEKEELLKVVNIMIDYNLNYVQERTAEGNYVFNLEPNILEVTSFKNDGITRKQVSYSNKQLIAREIDLEKMRRHEQPKTNENLNKKPDEGGTKPKPPASTVLPNHLQTLKKVVKTVGRSEPTVSRDFFGRIIEKPTLSTDSDLTKQSNDIWFKYKEGYNNAVKKTIKISSLK